MSPARLARYMTASTGDKHLALRLYVWNARICEALYLPIQFAEVAARNAVQIPVGKRFGVDWFANPKLHNILSNKMQSELEDTVRKERNRRGAHFTQNHVIAGLSFGFWVRLMTSAYDKQLWANGVVNSFPNASRTENRAEIYSYLENLRKFRNDVAHHVAIFDRKPSAEFQNTLHIVRLVCAETHWISAQLARVNQVINSRPS